VRRAVPFVILAGCLVVGVLPALAAPRTVNAGASSWSPSEFAVMPADTVTWMNKSGFVHNLHVDGAKVAEDGAVWTYSNTYAERSQPYPFHCSLHPGMSGRFYVNATGTVPSPSPTAAPSGTASPGGTATPSPTSTAGAGPAPSTAPSAGGGTGATVSSFRLKATKGRFCTRRTARCRTPGVFLTIDLGATQAVRVRGTLKRGARKVRSVSLLVRPGRRRVRLPGKALRPGRYSLTLKAGGFTRRVSFRVPAS